MQKGSVRRNIWQFLPPVRIKRSDGGPVITDPKLPKSVIMASLALNLLGLGLPLCLLQVYDRVLPNKATETLGFLILGLAIVLLLDAILKMTRATAVNWIAGSFTYNASLEAFRRLMKAPPVRIERESVSVHMNRLNALTGLGDFYGGPSRLLLIDVPAAAVYLIIMGLIGGWIVLVPIALLCIFAFLGIRRSEELRDIIARRGTQDSRKYDFVTEVLSGIHTVKSMAMEPLMMRRFERLQKEVGALGYRSILVANHAQTTAALYSMLSTICVLVVGASLAIAGELSVGVVAACTLLSGQLIQPLMRGISAWADLQNTRHNFNEAMTLFDLPTVRLASPQKSQPSAEFSMEDVTFRDEQRGVTIIEDFNLSCSAGDIVGLRSWDAGERLALSQLMRGYERPAKGRVLLDGQDISDPANAEYTDHIAYLGSAPVIFQGTILDNLTVFGHRADVNRARRVARELGLEEEINQLPDGYDTKLGRGVSEEISRAMTQWITIARTIALKPKVLILENALQALDTHAAQKLLNALALLKKDMVIILISQFDADLAIATRRFDLWGGQLISAQESRGPDTDTAPVAFGPDPKAARPAEDAGRNAVHSQLKQLEAELTAAAEAGPEDQAPAAQLCLDPLLMWLGWHGVGRHLYEALPHVDRIETIEDLRAVLFRLNYMTEPKLTKISKIDHEDLPCLFVSDNKIYVLLGFEEDNTLAVFDSSTKEFTQLTDGTMSGVAYLLKPLDVEAERKQRLQSTWLSFVIARFRESLVLILSLGFVMSILALALPIYTMTVYDKAIGADSSQVLIALTGGMLLIVVIDLMLRWIRGLAQAYFGARLDVIVGNNAFSQVLHMQVSMTESTSIASQLARLRQLETIRDVFTGPLANALIDLPFIFVFVIAIAVIAGALAWIPVLLTCVYLLLAAIAIPLIQKNINRASETKTKLQNIVLEALSNQRAIRNISAEQIWIERFQKYSEDFGLRNLQTRSILFNTQTISQTLMLVAGVTTLAVGTLQALNGTLSTGALIGAMALSWRVLNPLHQAFVSLMRLGQMLQSLDQINKLMRLPVERIPNLLPPVYRGFQGQLELRRIVFAYPGSSEVVLRGLNCTIDAGEIVSITGVSGSGKSSVQKIILGLYPLQGGAILADGRDIRQLDPGEWRHAISYVPKNCQLFYGTIGQNIRLANPSATDVEIAQACREAGVFDTEFEEFMPEGLETRLTRPRMQALPDELRQRINLARGFAKPSPIYLFNSPSQNLSTRGVECLLKKLQMIRGKSSVIIVSQNPALIEASDRVLHMTAGQVTWQGSPHAYVEKKTKAA